MAKRQNSQQQSEFIKPPNLPTEFKNDEQHEQFLRCCDPDTGYQYFLENFFYIQHPTRGSILYDPYPYQVELAYNYHNYNRSINMLGRQMGKTTTAAGYLLWYAMFVPDSTVLIAAHKYTGAQEIMQRIRYAYEQCPWYIKAGVTTYNKGNVDFDNGSRIVASTTTENTGRGMAISLLYCLGGDTKISVRTDVEREVCLADLHVELGGQSYAPNSSYKILTPTGWKKFKGVSKSGIKFTIKLILKNDVTISATHSHTFYINGLRVTAGNLKCGDRIDTAHGQIEIGEIEEGGVQDVYDIIEVDDPSHQFIIDGGVITKNCDEMAFLRPSIAKAFYTSIAPTLSTGGKAIITSTPNTDEDQFATLWFGALKCEDEFGNKTEIGTNGYKALKFIWSAHPDRDEKWERENRSELGDDKFRQEMACEFVSSDETLINSGKLAALTSREPVITQGQVRWFKTPVRNMQYVVALDPSLGTGGDNASIEVFEANTTTQVAEWKHNKTPVPDQIKLLADICNYIFDHTLQEENIYYSVENNTIGEAALQAIDEYGEDNIPGTFVSEIGKKRRGFLTGPRTKVSACVKFKQLIENGKMGINSKPLISELKNFVAKGGSYAAKPGTTDDLVMASVLAVRMIMQIGEYHTEVEKHVRENTEVVLPMPFMVHFNYA